MSPLFPQLGPSDENKAMNRRSEGYVETSGSALHEWTARTGVRRREPAKPAVNGFAKGIIAGLTAKNAWISSKYFYDAEGSRLFERITRLPEYYPTRTEQSIMAGHAAEVARSTGIGVTLIDLGAGNCEKAKALFPSLKPAQYVAVDISGDFLEAALRGLRAAFPDIDVKGITADVSAEISLPASAPQRRRLFFYPGSSIGNFMPDHALALLARIRKQCKAGGGLLIGVDLVKPAAILERAYDDSEGVTAAFNLNVLRHLNALIGTNFAVTDWRHCAFFNAELSRIEMHLAAKREVSVSWPGGGRLFRKAERIHTENSYKYRLPDFERLLVRAGFKRVRAWTDAKHWFAVCHAAV
jgi:L-histidine N-alpha-methyltransferase